MRISIVTDSTAYLPEGFAKRHAITVVPLHVAVDGAGRLDGVDFGPFELASALAEHRRVTTSRPTPGEMAAVYREALSSSDAVVSVHLSRELSGTWEAARLAAEEVGPSQIRVVDSRSTGMGLGFSVLRACAAVAAGHSPAEVEAAASSAAHQTRMFFCLETLDHLRRGGRIGTAAALVGTALAVKPLLHMDDGRIVPLEKVRTISRAVGRLVDLAAAAAGDGPVGLAVHHLAAPERAAELATRLDERLPGSTGCVISEVGAVIGAHTGPGVLGVVVLPGGPDSLPQTPDNSPSPKPE
ncbi:DegV family protein [Lentzea flaviverrucosa]|uniref:EDD domain protein, DegV family n=1 Tax=Lentzea flaviverrucosa TaxID=200379 RepID=A0A1H9XNS6_9PSEU|nr:DegV family protein [Lentzea flaviverrucosa]RDI19681.1 DegV family protein with EDD domain [Lentzea flaviverrucosa]SES47818.1 EDD domain protein, DegV family [Lentzea flaviverrucosa]